MKIQATKKFSKLGSSNNWAGFGKETYIKLESGDTVEVDKVDQSLVEGGFVKQSVNKKNQIVRKS